MIELPESYNIAQQLNVAVKNKRIASVVSGHTPHRLAWYYGEPSTYSDLLVGRAVGEARALGGFVEIKVGDACILVGEGVAVRFHAKDDARPQKHQLLIEFADSSALSAAVQMYGGLGAFRQGELDNPYYAAACQKPSPFSTDFDRDYFENIVSAPQVQKLSLKALLATEQRIPGLGNGVLQDILFNAGMHPKKKAGSLVAVEKEKLLGALKSTLSRMAEQGGRDTEMDLFGRPGDYRTIMSKNSAGKACPVCKSPIQKESYLGGSVYYCTRCQSM